MHDIYAYGLGLYTLIATILFVEFAADKLSQLRAANDAATLKRDLITGVVRLGKWLYLIVFGCVLLPLLAGMCLDLYVMLPCRRWFAPDAKVEMQILQNWAFGVIHLKIAGRFILYLDGRVAQHLRNVPTPFSMGTNG
jgi:E3 ubiquitin-protein ligase MARCH6